MRKRPLLTALILVAAGPALAADGDARPSPHPGAAAGHPPAPKVGTYSGLDGEGLRKDDDRISSRDVGGGMGTAVGTSGVANGTEGKP